MKKVLNVIGIILSIIATLIYISAIFSLTLTLITKDFISEKTISNLVGENILEIDGKETPIGEEVYKFIEETDISKDEIKEFINQKDVKELIGKYASSYINSVIKDEKITCQENDFKNLFNSNKNFFKKLLKEEYEDMEEMVKEEKICELIEQSVGELNVTN